MPNGKQTSSPLSENYQGKSQVGVILEGNIARTSRHEKSEDGGNFIDGFVKGYSAGANFASKKQRHCRVL